MQERGTKNAYMKERGLKKDACMKERDLKTNACMK